MSLTPDHLLQGQWGSLPIRRPSNLVRIFLSSAPADMAAERGALMALAYPEVQGLCQQHGLMLEVVDLRWGIHDGTATGQAAAPQLFLEEIRRCQELSAGPSFIALLGSHYGHCPAPLAIGEQEWEALQRTWCLEEPQAAQLLAQWYLKDDNAIPPAYILQRSPQASPGELAERLVPALRRAARAAEARGLMSQERRWHYDKSETHQEVEAGLSGSGRCGEDRGAAIVFFREGEALGGLGLDGGGAQLEEDGGSGEREMPAKLMASLSSADPERVRVYVVPRNMDPDSRRCGPRPKDLCEQFVAAASHGILGSLRCWEDPPRSPLPLFQELAHHAALAQELLRGPCWQPGLVVRICQRMKQQHLRAHPPLLIHGPPGCGKTALVAHLCGAARAALGQEAVVVLRLVGTSQDASSPGSLLRSLGLHIRLAMGLPPAGAAEAGGSPCLLLSRLLRSASRRGHRPLLVLLDSVERLGAPGDPPPASWVPRLCPPKVHLVLSSRQEGCGTLLRATLDAEDAFEVGPLSLEQATEALSRDLAGAGRTLRPAQWALFQRRFPQGGLALPVAWAIGEARQWASHIPVSALEVPPTSLEFAHGLCRRLEAAHGPVLVGHVLGYLACARHGLSEAELKDALSLDDEVLLALCQSHPLPSQGLLRFPPLLWAQLRRDLAPWLEDRWADGFGLLGFRHREFSAVVEARYLSTPEERTKRHLLLADFFRGTWSRGMKKPIQLPSSSKPVSLARKVTPQPLWFSGTVANRRKLSELPFHLLQAGLTEELQRDVLGNMSWIACRAAASGVESLVADFDLCLARFSCPELRLLREALALLSPALHGTEGAPADTNRMYVEMLARLPFLAPSYPGLVGRVGQQCRQQLEASPHPVLIPLCGFCYPPGGPLRKVVPGFPRGTSVLECCLDQRLLLAGSLDGSMIVWDLEDFAVQLVLTGHSAEVRCVSVFGEGRRAASAALDCTLRLWSLESGREQLCIHVGDQPCCQLRIDERNRIVYGVSGSEVAAWHLETAAPAFRIPTEPLDRWLCAAVFVPRLLVVTVSEGGALCLWDSLSGELHAEQRLPRLGEEAPTCHVLLQKRGRMVAGFRGGSLLTVSSDGSSTLDKLPGEVHFVVPSKDESLLATGFGRRVRVFLNDSVGFRQLLASDLRHEEEVRAAAVLDNNTTLVTSSEGDSIWVWHLSQEGLLTNVLGNATATPTALLALWEVTLVSASRHAPDLRVWDLSRACGHKAPLPPCMAGPACVGLSHGARYVYFPPASSSCKVVIWDAEEGKERDTLDASAPVRCLEVAEQQALLFVGLASGTVLAFPLDSRRDVGCIPPAESLQPVLCLALTQKGDQLAIAGADLVQVRDVAQGETGLLIDQPAYTFRTQIPDAAISSLALLAGYRALYGMTSGELFLYHCPQGRVFSLDAHGGSSITCLQPSHGERWALSGSADALRCLWDLELHCWEHQMTFRKQDAFSHGVLCACFSEDDQYLFTGSLDQCVTVWDVPTGSLLAVQFVHAKLTRIVSTADGFVATTSLGYLVREKFHCPSSIGAHHNPLGGIKATYRVKSQKRGDRARQPGIQKNAPLGRPGHANKLSQICGIV